MSTIILVSFPLHGHIGIFTLSLVFSNILVLKHLNIKVFILNFLGEDDKMSNSKSAYSEIDYKKTVGCIYFRGDNREGRIQQLINIFFPPSTVTGMLESDSLIRSFISETPFENLHLAKIFSFLLLEDALRTSACIRTI